jgi:hypothetical protein
MVRLIYLGVSTKIKRLTDGLNFLVVVWVPDPRLLEIQHSCAEKPDLVLKSLEEFVPEDWGLPPYNATNGSH